MRTDSLDFQLLDVHQSLTPEIYAALRDAALARADVLRREALRQFFFAAARHLRLAVQAVRESARSLPARRVMEQ